MGGLAVDHMRFMHHVINCSWLITVHAQCAVMSQREATQAFTWNKKQQQQQLALSSGNLKDMQLWYLCINRRNQLCGRLFRSIRESCLLRTPQKCFCLVTDPSEVFLPCYKPLRSVAFNRYRICRSSLGWIVSW